MFVVGYCWECVFGVGAGEGVIVSLCWGGLRFIVFVGVCGLYCMEVWRCWEGVGGFTCVNVMLGWDVSVSTLWATVDLAVLWAAASILYICVVLVCIGGQLAPPICMLQFVDIVLFVGECLVAHLVGVGVCVASVGSVSGC